MYKFMNTHPSKKGTLYVITCFEKSVDYLFNVLENAPKKYRNSFVMRIESLLLDIDECLVSANMTRLEDRKRREYQDEARVKITVLCSILRMASNQKCISFSHYENATSLLTDTLLYLEKWMKSDEERRKKD